jgi:hypothetical protein
MSNYSKSSTAIKEKRQNEVLDQGETEFYSAKIIPWPDIGKAKKKTETSRKRFVRLEGKYLYHRGEKIPILQFQKSGYDKLLKLIVKEIER